MYGDESGDPGDIGVCGLHPGLNPPAGLHPLASDAAYGEKAAAPGVIPDPIPGDQEPPYPGVAPSFHGVICGERPEDGEAADPKNIPLPGIIIPPPIFNGIGSATVYYM